MHFQIYKRLYGKSEEERVRVACRAATTQSLSAYFSNRYAACEAPQDAIAVYMDVGKLLEELCAEVEQMSSSHEQCLVSLDAICALLTTSNLKILTHQPFVNLLWEKVCPLIILLLGIPQKGMSSSGSVSKSSESGEEPVGEGQMDFALAPAVITNPHTWRALYQ
uniref:Uncharacterized protein n=1 Tax=Caenorhabditis japonica TaxID=281687 RepID=A0A8R1I306_CAEJA